MSIKQRIFVRISLSVSCRGECPVASQVAEEVLLISEKGRLAVCAKLGPYSRSSDLRVSVAGAPEEKFSIDEVGALEIAEAADFVSVGVWCEHSQTDEYLTRASRELKRILLRRAETGKMMLDSWLAKTNDFPRHATRILSL